MKVMNDILPQMASSEQFFFLGTDGWGKSDDLLVVQNGQKLVGSLTVATELPLNLLFGEDLRTVSCLWHFLSTSCVCDRRLLAMSTFSPVGFAVLKWYVDACVCVLVCIRWYNTE